MGRFKRGAVKHYFADNDAALDMLEKKFKSIRKNEIIPYAKGVSYIELCHKVIPDHSGEWKHSIHAVASRHMATIGAERLGMMAYKYMEEQKTNGDLDILSIMTGLEDGKIILLIVFRQYDFEPDFNRIFDHFGEYSITDRPADDEFSPTVSHIIDDEREVAEEESVDPHIISRQKKAEEDSTFESPFLNSIKQYVPENPVTAYQEPKYDLLTRDMSISTMLPYADFISVFRQCMQYVTGVEMDTYIAVVKDSLDRSVLDDVIEAYIYKTFISTGQLPQEDYYALKKKIDSALYDLYIVKDLIDDPEITDIKITDYDSIRVRVKGKAYLSNVTFIDNADYMRFIKSVAIRNRIDLRLPAQTFTDNHNSDYILRFTITSPYIMCTGNPSIHIRKLSRKKLMAPDLINAGMMDEKIRDYLLDCGRNSRGIVFAGPPGSGKTTILNWFLEEAYEPSAEILVIQENDELYASERRGVMFEHVVTNPKEGERECTLEDLGKIARVAGVNVFVIGEAKGAEICTAITLSNSGCRSAITIHSPSSTDTIDQMADLAMRGDIKDFEQAKRMMKSFETIVYLEDFKVQEISRIIGFDDEKKDMVYRYIYRRQEER